MKDIIGSINNFNYDKQLAAFYAEKYAEFPNLNDYPYYKGNDCANFVSQVLHAGGAKQEIGKWDNYKSWFCSTRESKDLKKVSITWRAARYFNKYWGNDNGIGKNKAYKYIKVAAADALIHFDMIYEMLNIGDVLQYSDLAHNNYPYHTQVVHKKNQADLFIAQHTANAKNISLYKYLNLIQDKPRSFVHIYII